MAQAYYEKMSALVERATSSRFKNVTLEVKHFFSGAALYANGKICMSWTPAGFAMKLPKAHRDKLIQKRGVKRLRYFPKGPTKKEYLILPQSMMDEVKILRHWAKICIEHVVVLSEGHPKK